MSAIKNEMVQNISAVEIMQFMTHNSLLLYKKKGSNGTSHRIEAYNSKEKHSPYQKGVVFVTPSKNDLAEGKGYIVTSYETLHEKRMSLSHWTPNTFRGGTYYNFHKRIIKGHTRDNLKQINVIAFDIDTKNIDLYALYLGCEELGLPRPNVLLETPRGFQFFFVLDTPFYIHKNHDYKALRVAERLSDNIRKAISTYVPVDTNCAPFGFYRIPREDNVLDFYNEPANTKELLSWSMRFEKQEKRSFLHVIYKEDTSGINMVNSDWYRALICATDIDRGHYSASRNNAVMTLALANYVSGRSFEESYDELDEFNSNLSNPLNKSEFDRILKSAYSGKYKGVKRSYVEGLLENWTNGQAQFEGREGWYKFKKPREERVRSHYLEREEDILSYLAAQTCPEKPFLEGSLSMLAERSGMAVSTLKEVLKRSKKIIKRTVGHGRAAVTKLASRNMLFKNLLLLRKKQIKQVQLSFAELLPEINGLFRTLDIPALEAELLVHEVDLLYEPGYSPPDLLIS